MSTMKDDDEKNEKYKSIKNYFFMIQNKIHQTLDC